MIKKNIEKLLNKSCPIHINIKLSDKNTDGPTENWDKPEVNNPKTISVLLSYLLVNHGTICHIIVHPTAFIPKNIPIQNALILNPFTLKASTSSMYEYWKYDMNPLIAVKVKILWFKMSLYLIGLISFIFKGWYSFWQSSNEQFELSIKSFLSTELGIMI